MPDIDSLADIVGPSDPSSSSTTEPSQQQQEQQRQEQEQDGDHSPLTLSPTSTSSISYDDEFGPASIYTSAFDLTRIPFLVNGNSNSNSNGVVPMGPPPNPYTLRAPLTSTMTVGVAASTTRSTATLTNGTAAAATAGNETTTVHMTAASNRSAMVSNNNGNNGSWRRSVREGRPVYHNGQHFTQIREPPVELEFNRNEREREIQLARERSERERAREQRELDRERERERERERRDREQRERRPRRPSVLGNAAHFFDPNAPGPGETQNGDGRTEGSVSGDLRALGGGPGLARVNGDGDGERGTSGTAASNAGGAVRSLRAIRQERDAVVARGRDLERDRDRAPSLGDIHQELEQEQEAHVNRLLVRIAEVQPWSEEPQQVQQMRQQQQLQQQAPPGLTMPLHQSPAPPPSAAGIRPRSPILRSSADGTRQTSRSFRNPSHTSSPASPSLPVGHLGFDNETGEFFETSYPAFSVTRDNLRVYQSEVYSLTRENQMLKQRVRELERQLNELTTPTLGSPVTPSSNLAAPPLEANQSDNSAVLNTEE